MQVFNARQQFRATFKYSIDTDSLQLYQYLNPRMPVYDVTDYNQIQQVLQSSGTAVIDCHAKWCGPCVAIAPYATQKSDQTGIPMLKIDVDVAPQLSGAYQVSSMPTFLVVKGSWNNVIYRVSGGSQQYVDYVFSTAQQHK